MHRGSADLIFPEVHETKDETVYFLLTDVRKSLGCLVSGVMSNLGSQCRAVSPSTAREPLHRSIHADEYPSVPQVALGEINDAVIAFDDRLRISYCNRAAEQLYDFSALDVVGM